MNDCTTCQNFEEYEVAKTLNKPIEYFKCYSCTMHNNYILKDTIKAQKLLNELTQTEPITNKKTCVFCEHLVLMGHLKICNFHNGNNVTFLKDTEMSCFSPKKEKTKSWWYLHTYSVWAGKQKPECYEIRTFLCKTDWSTYMTKIIGHYIQHFNTKAVLTAETDVKKIMDEIMQTGVINI